MLKLLSISVLLLSQIIFSQKLIVLEDNRLPGQDTVLVFTPDDYQDDISYPLVFLLHGYTGNYNQRNYITDIQAEASKYNFIIVCPDAFYDSWYINSALIEKSQYRTFFFETLLPTMISKFNIDTSNIFITGLSMGGFGAMSLFLYKPDVSKAAGSTSGILDITKFPDQYGMDKIIGNFAEQEQSYHTLSPINQLENNSINNKTLIVDCGTEDFAYNVNQAFYERCRALKLNIIWTTQPGTHDYPYWKKSVAQQLFLFSKLVKR